LVLLSEDADTARDFAQAKQRQDAVMFYSDGSAHFSRRHDLRESEADAEPSQCRCQSLLIHDASPVRTVARDATRGMGDHT
jgi:hypothetical protein